MNVYHSVLRVAEDDESDLVRVLTLVVGEARPPNLYSNLQFARAFRHPARLMEEERRCFQAFHEALAKVIGGTANAVTADLPMWLTSAGVTFRFEGRVAEELLVGEVDELLDEYRRILQALRDLSIEENTEEAGEVLRRE